MNYCKLSSNLPFSSMWSEDSDTRVIWITMLALKDRNGFVGQNLVGISKLTNIPLEKCQQAIERFMAPDPNSTTSDHDGRRIAKTEGGWVILNHAKYQELGWSEEKKEYERVRKAEYRKQKATTPKPEKQIVQGEILPTTENGNGHHPPAKSLTREFTDGWKAAYRDRFGTEYLFGGSKDGSAAARLLTVKPPTELLSLARNAWDRPDGFNCKLAVSIAGFASRFNEIVAELATPPKSVKSKKPW